MIVDFHTHIFPDSIAVRTIKKLEKIGNVTAFLDGREESLTASMRESGVDVSVIFPVVTNPEQFHTVNTFAVRLNEKYADRHPRLLSFGGIHPDSADYKKELRWIKDSGLRGIKLHPDYQRTFFDDIRYMRILDYASQIGLVSVVHAGVDIGFPNDVRCTVPGICRVLDEVDPKNLVLAHYGGFGLWEEVAERIAGRSVYLDTAYTFGFIKEDVFMRILNKHGTDHILFGTDSPWSGQKESLDYLRKLPLAKEDLEQILGRNAQRLIGLGGAD